MSDNSDIPEVGPGTIIDGTYELTVKIGAGAFGAVYKAKQIGMNREVAIKVLMTEAARVDPTSVQRFEHEAKLCVALEHPNTITVHAFGHSEGLMYLVMEYVRGRTLRRVMPAGCASDNEREHEHPAPTRFAKARPFGCCGKRRCGQPKTYVGCNDGYRARIYSWRRQSRMLNSLACVQHVDPESDEVTVVANPRVRFRWA